MHGQCDATPMVSIGYLPSCRASSPFDWYQFVLLGDRDTCVNNWPKVYYLKAERQELNHDPLNRESNVLTITSAGHVGDK